MKIGILTFAAVPNFGANLQALSTFFYFKNHGDDPILINWIPWDFQQTIDYQTNENIQSLEHIRFIEQIMSSTHVCRTSEDVAKAIEDYNIEAVVIGSDAVLQHHPLLSRIQFPAKKFFYVNRMGSNRLFPNPFWGEFEPYLHKKIPIAVMSGSNQSSKYKYIIGNTRKKMERAVNRFSYFSVRDEWTKRMIEHITHGQISPFITPDPVFAFNYNCKALIKSKEQIIAEYNLPDKYILFSIIRKNLVNMEWLKSLKEKAKLEGYTVIALPMPDGVRFKHPFDIEIQCPLSPLDWFALIKYSCGYIGQNMHPTVVALTNSVPVFCFDNYIQTYFYRMFANEKASKVYHILSVFGHIENRCSIGFHREIIPTPSEIFNKLKNFDREVCAKQASEYLDAYKKMMEDIRKTFKCRIS